MDNSQNTSPVCSSDSTHRTPFIGKTQILASGLVLAILGSIVAGSFEKDTFTNYVGFGMLFVGIAVFVVGTCSVFTANVAHRVQIEKPEIYRGKKWLPIYSSIWAIGAGLILAVLGSMLTSSYDQGSMMNSVGFGMLLAGIGVSVLGLSGVALETVRLELSRVHPLEVKAPSSLLFSIASLGLGVVFLVIGTILTGSYATGALFKYVGFGLLIAGVAILCVGASGTAVAMLKARFNSQVTDICALRSRDVFGAIWAIGIGLMLLIIGLILSGNFEKSTLMNYTGFGMLLSGAGIFVYGLFETAKVSAMGYLNYRLSRHSMQQAKRSQRQPQSRMVQIRFFWKNMVRTSSVFNLVGIIAAVCLLFFSLWQLDIIVSGPVWWSSAEQGTGFGWSHPDGAYANDYFQCFFWKTTIGQAYDTLFMLIFVSFIVIFLSAYFWPKQDRTLLLKLKEPEGERASADSQLSHETENSSEATAEPGQSIPPAPADDEIEVNIDY